MLTYVVNTKIISPTILIFSYLIERQNGKGPLENFNPAWDYFFFVPLYASVYQVSLIYRRRRCKRIYGHTCSLFCRNWIYNKLANREPQQETKDILDQPLAIQSFVGWTSTRELRPNVWPSTRNSSKFSALLKILLQITKSKFASGPQSPQFWDTVSEPGKLPLIVFFQKNTNSIIFQIIWFSNYYF